MRLLSICAIITSVLLFEPCYGQKKLTGKMRGKLTEPTMKQKILAREISDRQNDCTGQGIPNSANPCNSENVTAADCSKEVKYCDNTDCIKKILFCHEICKSDFDTLTIVNGVQRQSKPFARYKIERVLNTQTCDYNFLRIHIHERFWGIGRSRYRINKVSQVETNKKRKYETFYSTALLRGILNINDVEGGVVDSITLYRGIYFDTIENQQKYLVPFKVTYHNNNIVKYYDVSDTQP